MNKFIAGFSLVVALSGCMTNPEKVYLENQAKLAPIRNLTKMDQALACFDKQLVDYHVRSPIYVASTGIPNRAGSKVDLGSGEDMLKTSIGQLRSNVYHFIDLNSLALSQYGVSTNESGFRPTDAGSIKVWIDFLNTMPSQADFHLPGYLISGSISQLDGNVISDQIGGSVGLDRIANVGASADQILSVVTVDMQIMDAMGREIISGLTTKNSLAIKKGAIGFDLSGTVKTVGGSFSVSYDRSEGLHQGIRDLIQLSTIELLGRMAKVPYQRCLGMEDNRPGSLVAEADSFEDMNQQERIRFVQQRLAKLNDPQAFNASAYYTGPINGEMNPATREAIALFQRQAGLLANGEVNLELYQSLKNPPLLQTHSLTAKAKPSLKFVLEDGRILSDSVNFARHSKLAVGLLSDREAYAHCFLKNQHNQIYRIFPTLEQQDDHLLAGRTLLVPQSATIQIELDAPTQEEFACITSSQPLEAGKKMPLTRLGGLPMPNVDSLQQVFEQYQQLDESQTIAFKLMRFEVE